MQKKHLTKSNTHFMMKSLRKLGIEGSLLNLIRKSCHIVNQLYLNFKNSIKNNIYQKSTVNIIPDGEKLDAFSL